MRKPDGCVNVVNNIQMSGDDLGGEYGGLNNEVVVTTRNYQYREKPLACETDKGPSRGRRKHFWKKDITFQVIPE